MGIGSGRSAGVTVARIAIVLLCGASGVLRASPLSWTNAAGGSWSAAGNWAGSAGPPTSSIEADFNLNSTYVVNVDTAAVASQMVVSGGAVSFNLGTHTVQLSNNLAVNAGSLTIPALVSSPTVSAGQMGISGLSMNGNGILNVGSFDSSSSNITFGGGTVNINGGIFTPQLATRSYGYYNGSFHSFLASNAFQINNPSANGFRPILNLQNANSISSASSLFIGVINGTGELDVSGTGAALQTAATGDIEVGYGSQGASTPVGDGILAIRGGGIASTGEVDVAMEGGTGKVTIDGAGSILSAGAAGLLVGSNQDAVVRSTGTFAITQGGQFTTSGPVTIGQYNATGAVTVDGKGSTFTAGGALSLGSLLSQPITPSQGSLVVSNGGSLVSNGTAIGFGGGQGSISVFSSTADISTWTDSGNVALGASQGAGSISIGTGGSINISGSLTGTDTVSKHASIFITGGQLRAASISITANYIEATSQFSWTGGNLTITDGSMSNNLDGLTQAFTVPTNGTLSGNITSVAGLNVLGHLDPGDPIGAVRVTGGKTPFTTAYTQAPSGTLDIDLGGAAVGMYDQVIVSPNFGASLGGSLNVDLVNQFVPLGGEQFTIFNSPGFTGTFSGMPDGTIFNVSGYNFRINYNNPTGAVVLTAVPEPSVAAVLILGGVWCVGRKQLRNLKRSSAA